MGNVKFKVIATQETKEFNTQKEAGEFIKSSIVIDKPEMGAVQIYRHALNEKLIENISEPSPCLNPIQLQLNIESIVGLEERIEKAITERLPVIHKHVIKTNTETKTIEGHKHYQFDTLLKVLYSELNTMLIGPAGSGKTTLVEQVAEAMSFPFYCISVGMQTSKTDFLGYMDATGNYVKTNFRKAYEEGGVYLIDEIDAGNAGVLTIVNSALANCVCAFPDGMIKRHDNFRCVSSANTYGKGSDRMYVGRNQLDAATLDRFVKIYVDYDEKLELQISGNQEWTNKIQAIRKHIQDKKLRIIVSPRVSIFGSKLLSQGIKEKDVLEMTLFNGLSTEEINTIKQIM